MHIIPGESGTSAVPPTPQHIIDALHATNATAVARGVWTGRLTSGASITVTDPNAVDVYAAARAAADELDAHQGADRAELAARVMRVADRAGRAAAAWLGANGHDPRAGYTATYAHVVTELAETAFAALVAIDSVHGDPAAALARVAGRSLARPAVPAPVVSDEH